MSVIENYTLFGEWEDLPDVVHCETIEVRSLLHDWEFKPHRHARLHQFLLVDSGQGILTVEERQQPITSGDLVNVPMGVVHGFSFEPGTQGWVVTIASEWLEESMYDSEGVRAVLKAPKVVRFSNAIRRVVQAIFAEYPSREFARAHVLRSLSGVLAGLVARAISATDMAGAKVEHVLQRRFEALLEDHVASHLKVADYAALLGVTPTHLSRVMRQTTGQSASAAIEARLILQARRNLAFSNVSIAEVGYQVGFSDPAYFSRVFKRATGLSPREFRQRLGD